MLNVSSALCDLYDFEPRTPVCITYENSDVTTILVLAVIFAGGTVICTYTKDPYSELLYMALKVRPKFLFAEAKNLNWAKQLTRDLGQKVVGVAMDELSKDDVDETIVYFRKWLEYERTKSRANLPIACDDISNQIAFVMMSSGTTGKPKAVPYTHRNCLADLQLHDRKRLRTSLVCCASFDYVSGRLFQLDAVLGSYNAVLLNHFEPKAYLEAVEKYKCVAVFLGAAAFYELITYKHIDDYKLASLKMIFPMGSKVLYLDELRAFLEKRPHIEVLRQGFGSSETSGVAMNSLTVDEYFAAANNCGKLLPSCRAKIVDPESGRLLDQPNEIGILHVSGPTVFPGYYDVSLRGAEGSKSALTNNNDEDDKQTHCFDRQCFDADGFYITGDMAYFDADEQLHLVGRQKELMVCRAGKKVLPSELEAVLREHKAVLDVCVLGIADRNAVGLHCPRAFIVPQVGCDVEAAAPSHRQIGADRAADEEPPQQEEEEELQQLSHVGQHKLCSSLDAQSRRKLAEHLMRFTDNLVGWEKQLTGGIVLLDRIPTSRATGKHDKNYLRALQLDSIEIYGDRSGQFEAGGAD